MTAKAKSARASGGKGRADDGPEGEHAAAEGEDEEDAREAAERRAREAVARAASLQERNGLLQQRLESFEGPDAMGLRLELERLENVQASDDDAIAGDGHW